MMEDRRKSRIIIQFLLLIGLVLAGSFISTKVWGGKPEEIPHQREWVLLEGMTLAEFADQNNVPGPILKEVVHLQTKADLQRKIDDLDMPYSEIAVRLDKALALRAEHVSKNWAKILIKFGLWALFMAFVFVAMRKRRISPRVRKGLYFLSLLLFGVILGSDPSPMGTVKDAIVLFGSKRVFFPPRMIALTVFLATVVVANKFICSWGCQLGTLQDLIFRLNRGSNDRMGIMPQYKVPFLLTNGIRVLFSIILTLAAFFWAQDIVGPIDPFKIFNPKVLGIAGAAFIGALLVGSLFIYRPWCSLFCPFGLVGWLFEKVSRFKIKVNYDTCTSCGACTWACPSPVMEAILKQDRVIPDCFACGTCINVCPTDSISFTSGKRMQPPLNKFGGPGSDGLP